MTFWSSRLLAGVAGGGPPGKMARRSNESKISYQDHQLNKNTLAFLFHYGLHFLFGENRVVSL
jgi:hypothetical protein